MKEPSLAAPGIVGRPYLSLLEVYRGIASVAVVLHHVGAIALKQHKITFMDGFFSACHLRLDFFFILSGFIIAWLHDQDIGRPRLAKPFLVKRFCRIYPLLFVLTTAKLASVLATGTWIRAKSQLDWSLIASSYLMLPLDRFPLILAAWTMPYEVTFYLLFALAIFTSRRAILILACLWTGTILVTQWHVPAGESQAPFLMEPFHLQLMAGMAVGLWTKKYGRIEWGRSIMIVGFVLLLIGLIMHQWLESLPRLHARCWWGLVFCLIIPGSALYELSRKTPLQVPQWLKKLGKASYSTYLLHSPILVILMAWGSHFGLLNGPWRNPFLLMTAVIAIMAGLLCHRWLEQPLSRWTRRWTHPST